MPKQLQSRDDDDDDGAVAVAVVGGYGSTATLSHGTIPGAGRSLLASDWKRERRRRRRASQHEIHTF